MIMEKKRKKKIGERRKTMMGMVWRLKKGKVLQHAGGNGSKTKNDEVIKTNTDNRPRHINHTANVHNVKADGAMHEALQPNSISHHAI